MCNLLQIHGGSRVKHINILCLVLSAEKLHFHKKKDTDKKFLLKEKDFFYFKSNRFPWT